MNKLAPSQQTDRPTVVTFGGGKGGTGRTSLCADLARGLARSNQRVLCVDVSSLCPTLNAPLGAEEMPSERQAYLGSADTHVADFIQDTAVQSVWYVSLASCKRHPFRRLVLEADALLHQLHQLDFEWIFIDLPASSDTFHMELFVRSDLPVMVCTPEPSSVRAATQFLRTALYHAFGYHPDAVQAPEQMLQFLDSQPLAMNIRTLRAAAQHFQCTRVLEDTLRYFEPYLIVNQVREGSEHDLGFVLTHAWHQELGSFPRVLASIDYQDRRWFFNRRTTTGTGYRSEELLSKDLDQLTRSMQDLSAFEKKYPRPIVADSAIHPALSMGINPDAGRNDVRQHCRRLWEGYRRETTVALIFEDPGQRLAISEQLEEIYRKVLTLPSESFSATEVHRLRAQYANSALPVGDILSPDSHSRGETMTRDSFGPATSHAELAGASPSEFLNTENTPSSDVSAPEVFIQKALKEDIYPSDEENENPGTFIAELRKQRNVGLQELSKRTHIGVKYLAAIEQVDREVLPRSVYLRGYLREIARVLETDPQALLEDYFRFLGHS